MQRISHRFRAAIVPTIAAVAVLAATGCGASGSGGSGADTTAGDSTTDKLAQVLARDTLVLSTDLAYPPQSKSVDGATRRADTKCAANQLTAPEVEGYDVETGKLVADKLGVEPCFVTPTWSAITGGNWGDRWDVSWGSGAINSDRMTRLYMTQPYYSDQQVFYVKKDSPITDPRELSGRAVGACAGCTHELYLEHTLDVPGVEIDFFLEDPKIVLYDVESPGLKAVANGKIDAFICADPVGSNAIKEGVAIRPLSPSPFPLYATGFVDKSSGLSETAFVATINEIIQGLHADGSLTGLSLKWFGDAKYATNAADFDLATLEQDVT